MRSLLGGIFIMAAALNLGAREPRVLKIAQMGHPCLFKESAPITDFQDPELIKFMDDMYETFKYDIKQTAGLAAPQLHTNKRIILYWDGYNVPNYLSSDHGMELVKEMFNPTYEPLSDEMEYRLEGCKSLDGLAVDVPRYKYIRVKWQDREGAFHERDFQDREARCLQHEIDHLDGILCILRAENMTRVGNISGRQCFLEELGKERSCANTCHHSLKGKKLGSYDDVSTDFEPRIMEIAKIGHPCLYKECEEVKDPTAPEIKEIIDDMRATIYSMGYPFSGLAAPQVHINKNISFFFGGFYDERPKEMNFEPLTAMINLHIEPIGDEKEYLFERCFSSIDWAADVPRHKKIYYRYQDEEGKVVEGEASGFTARVLQHEYDHLMGKVCFMRVDAPDRIGYCDGNRHTHLKPLEENTKHW